MPALHLWECSPVESLFKLLQSFVFTNILYWIEAFGLIGELRGGVKSLRQSHAEFLRVPFLFQYLFPKYVID